MTCNSAIIFIYKLSLLLFLLYRRIQQKQLPYIWMQSLQQRFFKSNRRNTFYDHQFLRNVSEYLSSIFMSLSLPGLSKWCYYFSETSSSKIQWNESLICVCVDWHSSAAKLDLLVHHTQQNTVQYLNIKILRMNYFFICWRGRFTGSAISDESDT